MALRAVLPGLQRVATPHSPRPDDWTRPGLDAQPSARARCCPRQALEKDSGASSKTADHACGCRDAQDIPQDLNLTG